MDINPLQAATPTLNAVVSASAGTGKTWMLTTRIIRLLLAGAEPSSILAVTFTRKATAEMKQRVYERIQDLHSADEHTLTKSLKEMGSPTDADTIHRAKTLYPQLINNNSVLRISTFHSFCQDLLQRFPLEADVPPGFTLLESSGTTLEATWEALNVRATQYPNGKVANTLQCYFKQCDTLHRAKTLAFEFVEKASDWWAYTEGQDDPVAYATAQLIQQAEVPDNVYAPLNGIQSDLALLAEQFQARATNKTIEAFLNGIGEARLHIDDQQALFNELKPTFLTQSNTARSYKQSKKLSDELGEEQSLQHVALVADVAQKVIQVLEYQKRQTMLDMNAAWYAMGDLLLSEYQQTKTQKNQLDFSDLEWKTYQLLHHADNADWVQYKLDQRINHLLFDEFQDTNPTQWQLVKPLLNELASAEHNQSRSVFLVGDTKQSIYSFRRANPELQNQASDWLTEHLHAQTFPLNQSRRSAAAIMGAVNTVFTSQANHLKINHFEPHDTHHKTLWGRVECMPLIVSPEAEKPSPPDANTPLRNPLIEPKKQTHSDHHYQEAKQVAQRIEQLMSRHTQVVQGDQTRPLAYSDIYVLFRKRTHLNNFERAFKEANIPFSGNVRHTFFDHIEVQDMEALLSFLIAPFDNYKLAVILRSPLFQASHDDLLSLARTQNKNWWDALNTWAEQDPSPEHTLSLALKKAHKTINQWLACATALPVHDLIDHIFHTGDVIAHYVAATTVDNRAQTRANLVQFLHLALDSNSGRYPSLTVFLDSLKRMRSAFINDAPDQAAIENTEHSQEGVQLMTIHASKGMEAPVVFLVDTFAPSTATKAWESLIEWPSSADRPTHFLINPPQGDACDLHIDLLDKKSARDVQEEANLLYVAMTRAKHMLIISGSCKEQDTRPPQRGAEPKKHWYGTISNSLSQWIETQESAPLYGLDLEGHIDECGTRVMASGQFPDAHLEHAQTHQTAPTPNTITLDWQSHTPDKKITIISPSALSEHTAHGSKRYEDDKTAQHIGIYTHALLETMCNTQGKITSTFQAENSRLKLTEEEQALCKKMADDTFNKPELRFIFAPTPTAICHNEIGLTYTNKQGERVYGVIDRLVIEEEHIWIVDYKSTQGVHIDNAHTYANSYKTQLAYYIEGIKQLYPNHKVSAGIVFTALQHWLEMSS